MGKVGVNALAVLAGIILCFGCSTTRTSTPPPVADIAPPVSVPTAITHTNAPTTKTSSQLTGKTPPPAVVPVENDDPVPGADPDKSGQADGWYWLVLWMALEVAGGWFDSR
jgi:hypothetical protein